MVSIGGSNNNSSNAAGRRENIHATLTWQEITQAVPPVGIPLIPETPQEECPPVPVPPDTEFTNPGAFPVEGRFISQDDNLQEQNTQAPIIDALVTHTIRDENDEGSNLFHQNTETTFPNERPQHDWGQKLLRLLSLEVNVALFTVIVVLLIFLAVSDDGHSRNNNKHSKSINQQNGAIHIPALAATGPTSAPTRLLDSLNLPNFTIMAIKDPRSPQRKAYQWLTQNINNTSSALKNLPKWRLIQRFALATFYYSTSGDYWVKHNGWLDWETNECSWEQLLLSRDSSPELNCNKKGEIKALAFWNANNMEGTIPPEISLLGQSLESFELNRQLSIRGTIPTEFGLLIKLTKLVLSSTNVVGTLPTELGLLQRLERLQITNCHLSGQIPSEVGNLDNLSAVLLVMADLTGSVPSEVLQLPGLVALSIDQCPGLNTESILHDAIANLQRLEWLVLSNRTLGIGVPIPSEIGMLTELKLLGLVNWNIHGTIPSQLGKLGDVLTSLDLRGNSISGSLPHALWELTNLVGLHLGSNMLDGTLPHDLFSKLTKLTRLCIKNNNFSGLIPPEVGLLSSLKQLELQNTNLAGTLPAELLVLENLTSVVLQNTSLWGSIPGEMCDKLHQLEMKCIVGGPTCQVLQVKTNTTVCHGTSLCGCDCAPCPGN
ncbi:LRR receptor-like serine threonine-protein kinase [Seminavis robusta]|uniref:LRR receptor-like serine threonine-protein kinase n=1 Tax=Seminavis robusta TaxID=568900 RepID=A0A9N8E2L2_9STRA|nr:LRR receptor-like serine threonine-protein kinase [Seminavis robusta]|eukprot:Sro586_g171160.1 LRR receptor-like serine threonine-protein kinase (660) ;mRNA; r:25575-27863